MSGWVDWNVVLDRQGGPNHVGNFCGAPIMIDKTTQEVYYTPIYDVLAQFSRTIRPGDRAVATRRVLNGLDADALHACATLNCAGAPERVVVEHHPGAHPLQPADRGAVCRGDDPRARGANRTGDAALRRPVSGSSSAARRGRSSG